MSEQKTKPDEKLEDYGKVTISWDGSHVAIEQNLDGYIDTVMLVPEQALEILSWLEAYRPRLKQLAKEQE